MKKTIIRLICVLLLVALFACALISCENSGKNEGKTEPTTTAGEEVTTKKSIKPTVTTAAPETTAEPVTKEPVDTSKVNIGESDPDTDYGTAVDMH